MPRGQRLTLKRIVEPTGQPVDLASVKSHLRIDIPDDDVLLGTYIATATRTCEEHTRRAFMLQTWRLTLDDLPDGELNSHISPAVEGWDILLPRPPYVSGITISYKDTSGATQSLVSGTDFLVLGDDEPCRIALPYGKSWPDVYSQPGSVVVSYVAGYATAAAVPDPIKQAICFLVGHYYENREATIAGTIITAVPMAVDSLLSPFICQEQW